MLCERCKMREAIIQYTEVINGVKREHNFCTQCAKEIDFSQYSALFDHDFPLAKLLSGLLGEESDPESTENRQIVCPTCGTTYPEFVDTSEFGCADCYEVFDILMEDNIKKLQGNDTHKGKKPKYGRGMVPNDITKELEHEVSVATHMSTDELTKARDKDDKIAALKKQLQEAIKEEEYETAARLRDEIRNLQGDSHE